VTLAAIPSPTTAVWQLGPVPIRAYALCIVLGIVVAGVVTEMRLRRRGAPPGVVLDIAIWAVPFGIVGARIYHVLTSPQHYFGEGGQPLAIFKIWEGGLGIWGAVAGGALGAWLAARQAGIPLTVIADALAPGLPLGQAIGRFGNWFNNELYGTPTTLPWGLEVHRMVGGRAERDLDGNPITEPGLYHPTFAYEALWNVGVALLVLLVDRRVKLGRGRAFALYVMGYTVGRCWIEMLRSDPANEVLGLRLNVWTSILVFLGALIYLLRVRGPQEFLVPVAGDGESGAQRRTPAYRVVDEAQYWQARETGALPGDGAASAGHATSADEAASPESSSAEASSVKASAAEAGAAEPEGDTDRGTKQETRPSAAHGAEDR
jgi:prolipoprotein diacylglyceryl transferase